MALAKFERLGLGQPVERLRSLPVAEVLQSAWPAAVETRSDPNPSRCHLRLSLRAFSGNQLRADNVWPAHVQPRTDPALRLARNAASAAFGPGKARALIAEKPMK